MGYTEERGPKVQILLVEDETKVGNALSAGLQVEGYEIVWAQTGEEGFVYRRASSWRLNNWYEKESNDGFIFITR